MKGKTQEGGGVGGGGGGGQDIGRKDIYLHTMIYLYVKNKNGPLIIFGYILLIHQLQVTWIKCHHPCKIPY